MAVKNMKTAHWIKHTYLFRGDEYECSACGCVAGKPAAECPRCGRKIKGTDHDPFWVDEAELFFE